jgi:hypothetical protein
VIVLVAFSSCLRYTVLGDASSEKLSARSDREKNVVKHAAENRSRAIERRRFALSSRPWSPGPLDLITDDSLCRYYIRCLIRRRTGAGRRLCERARILLVAGQGMAQVLVPVSMGPGGPPNAHESRVVGQARSLRRPRRPPGRILSRLPEAFDAAR